MLAMPSGDGGALEASEPSRLAIGKPGGPTADFHLSQQPDPNEERFIQGPEQQPSIEEPAPVLPEVIESPPRTPEESADPSTDSPEVLFTVEQIVVEGSTVFDDAALRAVVAPLEGEAIALEDLQNAADAITQLYLDEGYLTSRAVVPNQTIADGTAIIQIIEGRISDITIEGTNRLRQSYIRKRVQLGVDAPLRTDRLEDQLRLLRADPLIDTIEASLRAGEALGESRLVVRVEEADSWDGELRADNYSPPSVGSERIGAELAQLNLTGRGDRLFASVDRTTRDGSTVVEAGYRIPLNPRNGTFQLRTVINRNEVVLEPFDEFDIEGESELYEASFRQPLVRSPREELAVSAGFSYRDGQTLAFDAIPIGIGVDDEGITRTSVFRLGQDYVRRDRQGAWALRSQFSLGADIFNATNNDDGPDALFFSWLAQAQRVQRLSRNQLLVLQMDLQLTPDPLLSSEQFVIGGGRSLRGFRQNVRAGDNGLRVSIEDQITLARSEAGGSTFQLRPFVDAGVVWNNSESAELPEQNVLVGVGVGALWEMVPDLTVRIDLAVPLIDLDDRGDNAQDDGVYFSVNYRI